MFGGSHLHSYTFGFHRRTQRLNQTGFTNWGLTVTLEEKGLGLRMRIISEVLCFV